MGYLVISLKVGERVKIGDVEILVSDYDRGNIDLSIDAPREIPITRLQTLAQKEFKPHEFQIQRIDRPKRGR